MATATWHENQKSRKQIGDAFESLFQKQVRCNCGGAFTFVGDVNPGFPDFTCDNCGQLADVKYSPISERTGNISVSATPWENYPAETLLVTYVKKKWIGEYKRHIKPNNEKPFSSTHHSIGTFKNTKFYLISWKNFKELTAFGYAVESVGN